VVVAALCVVWGCKRTLGRQPHPRRVRDRTTWRALTPCGVCGLNAWTRAHGLAQSTTDDHQQMTKKIVTTHVPLGLGARLLLGEIGVVSGKEGRLEFLALRELGHEDTKHGGGWREWCACGQLLRRLLFRLAFFDAILDVPSNREKKLTP
jgi:hypothetical protein